MDSTQATLDHIDKVKGFIFKILSELSVRAFEHDLSKLESPEKEIFDEFTPKLAGSTFGSEEYKGFLKAMKPALDHHYANNPHHPEFTPAELECNICFKRFPAGQNLCDQCGNGSFTERHSLKGMNLVDLVEMLCDWKAATLRHNDGDIRKSLEINQKRFGYSDELKQIFLNTLEVIEK